MRKTLALSVLLFLTVCSRATAEQLNFTQFGGLNTDDSTAVIPQGQTPDAENIITDVGPGLSPRNGFISLSTTTCTGGLWSFPHSNGTRYLLCHDTSVNILKASTNAQTFTITVSTVAAGLRLAVATVGNKVYFANTTDGLKSWDTSTVSVASAALTVNSLVTHKACLWASGHPSFPRRIFKSAAVTSSADPSWTLVTNPAATDPAVFDIGGGLDEPLTGLYASHQDRLIWFKGHSFGAILGSDRVDFKPWVYSDLIGTAYPESARDCGGRLRFLSSGQSIWEWDGSNLVDLALLPTTKIKTLMGTIGQGDANSRVWTVTSQADFQSGTIPTGLSATISSGDLLLSTASPSDNFSDGDYTSNPTWTIIQGTGYSAASGSLQHSNSSGAHTEDIISTTMSFTTGNVEFNFTPAGTDANVDAVFLSTQASGVVPSSGYRISLYLANDPSPTAGIYKWNGSTFTAMVTGTNPAINVATAIKITRAQSGELSVYYNGVLNSSTTDTTYTTFSSFHIQSKTPTGGSAGTAIFDDIQIYPTSATYQSQAFNIGTAITSWGQFSATTSGDGTHTFVLYTDTDSAISLTSAATFTSSQTITSGSIPTVTTAAYVTVTDNFVRTASTQAVVLNDFSLNWTEGSTVQAPAVFSKNRYWLALAANSTSNNRVLVFDRNRQWQKWVGINASAMALHAGSLIFSNASGTFQAESGYNDNGTAISAYYKTSDFSPAGPNLASAFNDLYLTSDYSAETVSSVFQVDGVNTNHSLSSYVMNSQGGIQNVRLPFSSSDVQRAKNINIKWTVGGTTFWRIVGGTLDYTPDVVAP